MEISETTVITAIRALGDQRRAVVAHIERADAIGAAASVYLWKGMLSKIELALLELIA